MNESANSSETRLPVVVGVDGWDDGERALLWAADEATRRGTSLHIVHAWQLPRYGALGPPVSSDGHPHGDPIKRAVEAVLRRSRDSAHRRRPDLPIETSLLTGSPPDVLVEASRHAVLTVLGCRGLPGLTGLVMGAVGGRVVAHAHSPVVIVRGVREHSGPVVVGVSETAHSIATLRAAAEMASLREAPLHVIHVDRHPGSALDVHAHAANLRNWAHDIVASAGFPDVEVTTQLITGDPRHELLELSVHARLLVAGSHRDHSLMGTALGSVSVTMSEQAGCPVMICPKSMTVSQHSEQQKLAGAHG